jgi:hypothetical protein
MKKISKKLSLRTETLNTLTSDRLQQAAGGWTTIVVSVADWTTMISVGYTSQVSGGAGGGGKSA